MSEIPSPWDHEAHDRVEVPSLPLQKDLWREEFEYMVSRDERAERSRERYQAYFKKRYTEDAPLREYFGFAFRHSEVDYDNWRASPRTHFRVLARSGYEARKAALVYFGFESDEYGTSVWNLEERAMIR